MKSSALFVVVFLHAAGLAAQEPVRLQWKAFDPEVAKEYFQETVTDTRQTMKVMGTEVKQTQNQVFVYRIIPHGKDRQQNWTVDQEIDRIRMKIDIGGSVIENDSANAGGGGPLGDFVKALAKSKLRFVVNQRLEVKSVIGHEAVLKAVEDVNPAMREILKGVLSREALAQTLEPLMGPFPLQPVKKGSTWKRASEQNMGPLGSFKQDSTYTYEGMEGDLDRIAIVTNMRFAVAKDAGGLPFKIKKADFREAAFRGFALFDRKLGRFVRHEVSGTLQGEMVIDIGGMETTLSLQQMQETRTRSFDKRP